MIPVWKILVMVLVAFLIGFGVYYSVIPKHAVSIKDVQIEKGDEGDYVSFTVINHLSRKTSCSADLLFSDNVLQKIEIGEIGPKGEKKITVPAEFQASEIDVDIKLNCTWDNG